jgi:hypothetical protein
MKKIYSNLTESEILEIKGLKERKNLYQDMA